MSDFDPDDMEYFNDDVKMIHDMLEKNWDTYPVEPPVICYEPEQWLTSGANAAIYIYNVSRYNSVASIDYSTIQRTVFISIRISASTRPVYKVVADEVYRIILAYRRVGQRRLNGYTYLEIINDRPINELSGWYTTTIDVKLTCYNYPIGSDGFGLGDDREDGCCVEDDDTL